MCVSAWIVSSGCSQDNTVKTNSTTLAEQITNVVQRHSTNISTAANLNQTMVLSIGPSGSLTCPNGINIVQNMVGNFNYISKVDDAMTTDIKSAIINNLNENVKTMSQTTQDMLSTALNGKNGTDITTSISNIVKSNLTNDSLIQVAQSVNPTQTLTIPINGVLASGAGCTFTQNMCIDVFSSNIVDLVSKTVAQNMQSNTGTTTTDVTNVATSKGLNDIISSVTDFLTKSAIGLYIIIGVVVIVFGVIVYFFFQAGGLDTVNHAVDVYGGKGSKGSKGSGKLGSKISKVFAE
jgi:hypothetical protein